MAGATEWGGFMSIGGGSYNGLAFGPGTAYPVVSLDSLRGMASVRARDLPLAERHGSASLPDYAEPKTLVLTLGIRGSSHANLETLSEAVRQATPPSEVTRELLVRDSTRLYYAKPRRRALPEENEALWRLGQAIVEFVCPDPREYDAVLSSYTTALPTGGAGGMGFPTSYPHGFGSGGSGGDIVATNAGNVPAPLTLRINGPVTNPVVGVGDDTLQLSIAVAAGDFLLIDTERHTVLLNGTATRRGAVVSGSRFPLLPPGQHTVQYRAGSAYDAAATLQLTYRSAWL